MHDKYGGTVPMIGGTKHPCRANAPEEKEKEENQEEKEGAALSPV